MTPKRTKQIARESIALVHALKAHRNTEKANKLLPKARARMSKWTLAVKRLKYPSYKVLIPA